MPDDSRHACPAVSRIVSAVVWRTSEILWQRSLRFLPFCRIHPITSDITVDWNGSIIAGPGGAVSTTQAERVPVRMALSEDPFATAESAPWIGPLLALGTRASRFARTNFGRQLIVAVSVPRRDFAAVLVACGWVMARPAPENRCVMDVIRDLEPGTHVRVVTEREVILDRFTRLDEAASPPRLCLAGSMWFCGSIRALEAVELAPDVEVPARMPRPHTGGLGVLARLDESWDARLAASEADLAIVGARVWLEDDLKAFLDVDGIEVPRSNALLNDTAKAQQKGKAYKAGFGHGALLDLVLPELPKSATVFSRIYPASRFAEQLPLPGNLRAVVLDGNGAIRYLGEIEAPVVICVLDRSVADETSAEMIVQMRNTRGEPVAIKEDLGWRAPAGVEALAFTVAL